MSNTSTRRALVITGGTSGIGEALVKAFKDEWAIFNLSRSAPKDPVDGVTYVAGDVASDEGVSAMRTALAEQGFEKIHSLVHVAGVGVFGQFLDMPREEWERAIRLNLYGTLNFMQGMAGMVQNGGRVVLYSSGTVFKAPGGAAAYAATKAGIIGFARSFAVELGARDITCNVVAPGLVITPLATDLAKGEEANIATRALKRPAVVEDFVGPTRFFLSEDSGFVTGQTLVVDGGSIRR